MYLPQFKLSKLAAGIGSVFWLMAYAYPLRELCAKQIAPMIPLATTWPDYGRIATEQLETRALAAQDANDSAFVRAWRNSTHEGHAEGGPLSSNPPRNVAAAEPFAVDYGTDPEAAPMTAEAAVKYDRVRATRKPEPLTEAEHAELNAMLVELRAKPKRVRVRAKPLTAADIVIGGEYVPKRGNNKTPNLFVRDVQTHHAKCKEPTTVVHYVQKGKAHVDTMTDFLALAARRVNA